MVFVFSLGIASSDSSSLEVSLVLSARAYRATIFSNSRIVLMVHFVRLTFRTSGLNLQFVSKIVIASSTLIQVDEFHNLAHPWSQCRVDSPAFSLQRWRSSTKAWRGELYRRDAGSFNTLCGPRGGSFLRSTHVASAYGGLYRESSSDP